MLVYQNITNIVELQSLDISLTVREIYEGVILENPNTTA